MILFFLELHVSLSVKHYCNLKFYWLFPFNQTWSFPHTSNIFFCLFFTVLKCLTKLTAPPRLKISFLSNLWWNLRITDVCNKQARLGQVYTHSAHTDLHTYSLLVHAHTTIFANKLNCRRHQGERIWHGRYLDHFAWSYYLPTPFVFATVRSQRHGFQSAPLRLKVPTNCLLMT